MNSRKSRKTQKRMYLLASGGNICAPQRDTNMASPYKALEKWVKRFSECLAYELPHRPDFGKAFCLFISFHFPDSVLSLLTGLHFYFWWRDSENTELYLFFIRKSCNKLLKSTSSLNFDPYLYVRILLRFLWVNSYANEQKCNQWLHEESVYSWHEPELRRGKTWYSCKRLGRQILFELDS